MPARAAGGGEFRIKNVPIQENKLAPLNFSDDDAGGQTCRQRAAVNLNRVTLQGGESAAAARGREGGGGVRGGDAHTAARRGRGRGAGPQRYEKAWCLQGRLGISWMKRREVKAKGSYRAVDADCDQILRDFLK